MHPVLASNNLSKENPFWKLATIGLVLDKVSAPTWYWIAYGICSVAIMIRYFWDIVDEKEIEIFKTVVEVAEENPSENKEIDE